MVATEVTPGGVGSGGTEGHNTRARRHRRRVRKRRRVGDAGHGDGGPSRSDDGDNGAPPQDVAANAGVQSSATGVPSQHRRIIDRSARMARAEDELHRALFVSIAGGLANQLVDVLVDELARRYELPVGSLEFHRLSLDDFLLVLPDDATATWIYNEG